MSDNLFVAYLEGLLIAIEETRNTRINGREVRFSRAIFLVNYGTHANTGMMMFWDREADIILGLRVGKMYRFIAGLEVEEGYFLLYFLPSLTFFEELTR
jgi:hypothetical protein